jgi:hypothetical protein
MPLSIADAAPCPGANAGKKNSQPSQSLYILFPAPPGGSVSTREA